MNRMCSGSGNKAKRRGRGWERTEETSGGRETPFWIFLPPPECSYYYPVYAVLGIRRQASYQLSYIPRPHPYVLL